MLDVSLWLMLAHVLRLVTVFEETRERSNQTAECKESLLKDLFVHRGRPRLIRQGSTALLHKHKGAWLGPATVLAQEKGMAQSGSWCKVDSCDVHLNICDISLNEKVCHSTEKKGVEEKARTFTDIAQDFKFSKGTHVDLRSQSDLPEGSEPRHLNGRIFFENAHRNVWNEFEWSKYRDDTCD